MIVFNFISLFLIGKISREFCQTPKNFQNKRWPTHLPAAAACCGCWGAPGGTWNGGHMLLPIIMNGLGGIPGWGPAPAAAPPGCAGGGPALLLAACCCWVPGGVWRMLRRHVGHVCWRWNQERRHDVWKMWLQGNFFEAVRKQIKSDLAKDYLTKYISIPVTISSRQMMQTLSAAESSSGVASG